MERFSGEYDAVISLGGFCMPAVILKLAGLRKRSYVFDWIFVGGEQLCEVINSRFSCFAAKDKLHRTSSNDVCNSHSGIVFMHHFQGHRQDLAFLEDYESDKATLDRHILRFVELIESSMRVLFIRIAHDSLPTDDCIEIEKCLAGAATNLDFELLFFNNQQARHALKRSRTIEHPAWPVNWWLHNELGYQMYWEELLSGIRLTNA